jgi:serine phosphatase RsbU (regulator of sigma subunit)
MGDFYDLFPIPGGWGVVIGDVCGKGPHAARTTALARSTVRALGHSGARPAVVLAGLNGVLLDWFAATPNFVTATYLTMHPASRGFDIVLARGGHPPALLRAPEGSVSDVGHPGTLLGVLPAIQTPEHEFALAPGASLVLYTDGVTEAHRPASEIYGQQRLVDLLSHLPGHPNAESIATTIEQTCLNHAGGAASDDTAILVISPTAEDRP